MRWVLDKQETLLEWMASGPTTLYHYTSMTGLLGIVKSGSIWATHINYLNDRSEQQHIWSSIKNRIERKMTEASFSQAKSSLASLLQVVEQYPKSEAYVASLKVDGDLLSQWSSYCPSGGGYAIGFSRLQLIENNIAHLRRISEDVETGRAFAQSAEMTRVMYVSDEGNDLLDGLIDIIAGLRMLNLPDVGDLGPLKDIFTQPNMAFYLMNFLEPAVKNDFFSAENEYRLVIRGDPPTLSFRAGKSTLIPYTEIPLNLSEDLFIERVVVGPCPDPQLTIRSLRLLFQSIGQPSVQIESSRIPHKSW